MQPYPPSQPTYPYLHPHQSQSTQDEFKSSYDDLIDEYAAPYAPNSQHHTYAVAPDLHPHHRTPSATLTAKFPPISKLSDDAHDNDTFESAYPPSTAPIMTPDKRSLWQKILPESIACRFYVMTVLIETTIDIAIEGELFLRVQENTDQNPSSSGDKVASQRMPVYLSIFALAHVFQLVLAVDAVYARNTLQFMALTLFNALFLVYAVIQIKEIQETMSDSTSSGVSSIPIRVLTTIIPIVIAVAEVAYIGLGWKIYHEFGWKVYKFLGADRRIKKMYASYQIFECLVKFDVFFWVGFSVQFIWLVLNETDWEFYVTCAALPLSLVLLVEGHLAARHENKWMMATFLSGCVGAMIYFIYKLIRVLLGVNSEQFKLVWKSLTIFSVLAIMLLCATFVFSIIVLRNFGKGLKNALEKRGKQSNAKKLGRSASTHPNRMSIN